MNSTPARPLWSRLLAALSIGLLATVAGSLSGALTIGLIGTFFQGTDMLPAIPVFMFFGLVFGGIYAWPTTLVILPAIWLYWHLNYRRLLLGGVGALTGGLTMLARLFNDTEMAAPAWTTVAAAAMGGLVAGLVFSAFPAHRATPPALP